MSNLTIVPVITTVHQPTADPDWAKSLIKVGFYFDPSDVLLTSIKTVEGLEQVLLAVIRIHSPQGRSDSPLCMVLFYSY